MSRELGLPIVVIERCWLERADITRQYERQCQDKEVDTGLLQPTRKHQDNLAGSSAAPGQEDLKDPDFTPEGEVDSEEEERGRKKTVEARPYKRRKRVEKSEEDKPSRGGKRKLTEQPAQSTVGVKKKSKVEVPSPPSSQSNRKSFPVPANSLKPSSVSVKNNDISTDLKKESPESCNVSDLPLPGPESPCSLKRSDTSSSTVPLDSEPEIVEIVKIVNVI